MVNDFHISLISQSGLKMRTAFGLFKKQGLLILLIVFAFSLFCQARSNQAISVGLAQEEISSRIYFPAIRTSNSVPGSGSGAEWSMVAANPERTSWTPEQVSGNLNLIWYRPVEAYISQNVQLIAAHGLIYVSTARGLYALNANTGDLVWRYDTDLPLGHSPTVQGNYLYVGGFDKKLHAFNARNGAHLWSFDGAKAGYSTNPLVIDGKVIIANRDGALYAVGAHGTASQGAQIWKFQSGGSINLSPAYKDGVVYFAANDNYAYAVRVGDGSLVWKSQKLPGDGFNSYWPVIYRDKVIFATASGYRTGRNPGTMSILDASGSGYGGIYDVERDELFPGMPDGALIGPTAPAESWARGKPLVDISRVLEYHEEKPWRRAFVVLNLNNGQEYTFDSDGDGRMETIPVTMWGTHSGNRYPPVVGSDGIVYQSSIWQRFYIPQGRVFGWNPDSPRVMSSVGGQGAVDEPQALSIGGDMIYRNICCDRVGDYFSIPQGGGSGLLWTYHTPLSQVAPNYDLMWWGIDPGDPVRLQGNYGNENGIYHNHGDQNPIIPYDGKLFTHRSNAIVAFGTGGTPTPKPILTIQTAQSSVTTPPTNELIGRIEVEVQKIIESGLLRPGYFNAGQYMYTELGDYFNNPGDTLLTLSSAYPHLSAAMQSQVRSYLQVYFNSYFNSNMIARIGWATGEPREAAPMPPEADAALVNFPDSLTAGSRWSWQYPQYNFYGMWKYAEIFPADALLVYNLAKSKIQVPVPVIADETFFNQRPWELNGYIGGYIGFLRLQELAGMTGQDAQLRATVQNELNRLMQMRANNFTKDTPWVDERYHFRTMNISRNFIMMTPELGDYLRVHALSRVQEAVEEYNNIGPYWFVARYNAVVNEGVMQNLYDYHGMFLAKAYILGENQSDLYRYLDVPAFERGDLFYIQNLIAILNAPTGPTGFAGWKCRNYYFLPLVECQP
jgi:outer membrane protein assembly factor BamB